MAKRERRFLTSEMFEEKPYEERKVIIDNVQFDFVAFAREDSNRLAIRKCEIKHNLSYELVNRILKSHPGIVDVMLKRQRFGSVSWVNGEPGRSRKSR